MSPWITVSAKNETGVDENAQYHDFRAFTDDYRPDWYFEQMVIMRYQYRVGFVGYTPSVLKSMAASGRVVGVYNNLVYDLTDYINFGPGIRAPQGFNPPNVPTHFMDQSILDVFQGNSGSDVTKQINSLNLDRDTMYRQKICLRNLFTIGKADHRNAPQCLFSTYILLVLSVIMCSIIGFKFLAALHFGAPRAPEDHDKFVVCQVPCYTEGE